MKTAVRWLAEAISKLGYVSTDILEQAEEMQKQQMRNAVLEQINSRSLKKVCEEYFDEHYNETYVSKGSDEVEFYKKELEDERNRVTSSQTEISDEEIGQEFKHYSDSWEIRQALEEGAKWYREQLKSK